MSEKPSKSVPPKSMQAVQAEIRDAVKRSQSAAPPAQGDPMAKMKTVYIRVAIGVAIGWVIALFVPHWSAKAVAGVLTLVAVIGMALVTRFIKKGQRIGALMSRAQESEEGRKEALQALGDFKNDDVQAVMAKAQLEMQDNPRQALETLEQVKLDKATVAPFADQIRMLRSTIHLQIGESKEARVLVDQMDLSKQQDPKLRVLFVTVASEAWARTGEAKKALETLEMYNPDDPEFADARLQMWRSRAFVYAALSDTKGIGRSLRKLAEISPQLLMMFAAGKKIHPLLEREAKQMLQRSGSLPKQVIRQR
ncbi:MAG: hypothetical protein KBF88_16345 [Polyangiaceae bacterium]|nr:hypothetical protein [Polyangiaceae bacterium]